MLLRFDGISFSAWQPEGTTEAYRGVFHTLYAARDGSLWVSRDLEVDHIVNQRLTRYQSFGFANAFVETSDGTIWSARSRGRGSRGPLCSFKAGELRCFDSIPREWATSLALDADGSLWLGSTAVLHLRDGLVLPSSDPTEATQSIHQVNALAVRNGEVWAGGYGSGTATGLLHYSNGRWKIPSFLGPNRPASASVLYFLTDGSLLIGTLTQGLYRVTGGTLDHLDTRDGLSGNAVFSILEDRENQIWIVSDGGLDKLRATSVRSYALSQGLISGQITGVLPLRTGPVLIGCVGGLDKYGNDKVTHLFSRRQLPGSQVTAMFEDGQRRIWIGIDHQIFIYANGQLRAIPFIDKDPVSVVRRVTEEPNGTVWVLTSAAFDSKPTIFRYNHGSFRPEPKLKTVLASDIVGTSDGLWFAEESGVRLFSGGKLEANVHVTSASDLADDPRGGLWIITLNSLSLWSGTRLVSLSRSQELPPDKLISAAVDREGDLWVSTTNGLLQVSKSKVDQLFKGDKRQMTYRVFGSLDGFQPDLCPFRPRIRPALDGKIWFPQETRAQSIDPHALVTNNRPPPVYLTGVVADRRSYKSASTVSLPAHTRDLRLEYTALSFAVPAAVRFRYRLDGWDQSWQEAGNRRDVSYTNLPPGRYHFRVRASNNDGLWNQVGASVAIVIPPAFYQTGWFTVSLCALLLSLSWLVFRLRLRTATNKVTRELTTRLRERERIARELHDTLLQGFQGLILKFQLVLDQLPPGEAVQKELESALQLSDEVMVEGRKRVMNLRDGCEEGDFVQSLREAEPFVRGTSSAEYYLRVLGAVRVLQPVAQGEILAIWKEAASNAFQHSCARRVWTEVVYTKNAFSLSIEDDGIGIEPQILQYGKRNHWGLQGMRERAQDIGAKLTVESDTTRGTKIHLRVDGSLCYLPTPGTGWWQRVAGFFGEGNDDERIDPGYGGR